MIDRSRNLILLFLAIQIPVLVTVFLDIQVIRQVVCFVYLSFLPGYLLLKIVRISETSNVRTIFLSIGLSIAFLMFIGLLLNTIYPPMGIVNPLSSIPLIASICSVLSILCIFAYFRGKESPKSDAPKPVPSFVTARAIVLISLPIMTVFGTQMVRSYANSYLLLLMIIIVSLIVLCAFSKRLLPPELFPLAVFVISLALLLHVSLSTNFLIGADVQTEYYFAKQVSINSMWDSTVSHAYNAMLSITILPVIYSRFLNWDIDWVFKVAYPVIYSFVPVILFVAYRRQTGSRIAFLSVFFFMLIETFYVEMLGLARQMIGELFFALLIFLIVEDKISLYKRKFLFLIFGAALVVSHYALAYIFLLCLLFVPLLTPLFARARGRETKTDKIVSKDTILLYSAITFGWNLFVSTGPFNALTSILQHIYVELGEHVPGPGIGGFAPSFTSPLHEAHTYLFYLFQVFIVLGFFWLIARYRKTQFNHEYSSMSVASMFILVLCVFVPSFAAGLVISRFYHIALFFLAPSCILGGVQIFNSINAGSRLCHSHEKRRLSNKNCGAALFMVAVLLVSLFLFQVGFIYEVTGDIPSSISLSRSRMDKWTIYMNNLYIDKREVTSARWFSEYRNNESRVYADEDIGYLTSYGLISPESINRYSAIPSGFLIDSYFYFGRLNVLNGIIEGPTTLWNVGEFSSLFNSTDKIYSNGASDIYFSNSR